MAEPNKTKNITELRKDLSEDLEHKGVTPITRNGNFSGVLISIGENDDATAKRLHNLVQRNNKVGIEQLRQIALDE